MIDKLELRLPATTDFHADILEFLDESHNFAKSARRMNSGRYKWVTDLRPIGRDALLHYGLKRSEGDPHAGEHKLELLDTGIKSYSSIVGQVEGTIEDAIDDLEIMRIDLCADLVGTPVEWFLDRLRIRHKRIAEDIAVLKYRRIGKAGIQTLSGGKRPNIVRVYDKKAEYKEQLKRLKRKRSRHLGVPTLESEFGIKESDVITRVERQFGGQRIPTNIDTFRHLTRLSEFNPFTNIEISNGTGARVPTIEDCGFSNWLVGTRLRELKAEMGAHQFRRWLDTHSNGNTARMLKAHGGFLDPERDDCITSQTLYETYRESVIKQLAA